MAVVGGTASVLGGGKLANGAMSAAFVHLFNAEIKQMIIKALGLEKAYSIAEKAASEVRKWGELFHWEGEHNGRWDAIRHCTGGCMIKNELGYSKAWLAGAGHELENIYDEPTFNTLSECSMDMHNNQVGFNLANGNSYYCIGSCYAAEKQVY